MPGSRVRSHGGLLAAAAALAVSGTVAGVGVAGAAEEADNTDVYARDANGPCFSTNATATDCTPLEEANVAIETGDTVTWHFDGSTQFHNAADDSATPAWTIPTEGSLVKTGSYPKPFNQPGTFKFICQAHPGMKGTITVTGDPVGTPTPTPPTGTPTPTPTASATPRPTPQPGGDDHTGTPAPDGGSDTVKPALSRVSVKALRRAARVRFRLSEAATVSITVKRKRTVLKSVRVQAPAGSRSVTVRSKRLKKGRYTVELRARDAVGNRSALTRKSLRLRR